MIEPLDSFDAALDAEPERLRDHWQPLFQYSDFPRYPEQIRRFQAHFPPEQIKIFLYEDYRADPKGVLRQIFEFAGVDANFEPTLHQDANAGGDPRSPLLQAIIMRPNLLGSIAAIFLPPPVRRRIRDWISSFNVARADFSPTARARLAAKLRPDILELQEMLGRDLSAWLQVEVGSSSQPAPNEAADNAWPASPARRAS